MPPAQAPSDLHKLEEIGFQSPSSMEYLPVLILESIFQLWYTY